MWLSSDCQNQVLLNFYLPYLEQLLKNVMGVLAVHQVKLLPDVKGRAISCDCFQFMVL